MKRPAFQFYPADWRKDAALQSCSISAQGLWIGMLCVMHECEPYGYLVVNAKAMTPAQLGRLFGLQEKPCMKLLDELEQAGVFSRDTSGTIFSRRMVKDERLRNARAEFGRLGGNPALLAYKVKPKDKPPDNTQHNQVDNLKPTPSASTASSPASINPALERTPDIDARVNGSHGSESKNGESTAKWGSQEWVVGSAQTFHMTKRIGESDRDFADRVKSEANSRRVKAQADARRHA